ncbi:MAG: ECF transporter S component [Microbacterium sp.]
MSRVSTAYLLTCAAIGVATGLLTIPATAAASALSPSAPPLAALTYGAWVVGFVVALRLIERPGAGVLTGLISGLVAAPFSTTGAAIVITNVLFAFLVELPFLVTRYRRWPTWLYFAGAGATVLLYTVWRSLGQNLAALAPWAIAAFYAAAVVSVLASVWLGIVIADRLRAAGVARLARRRPDATSSVPDGTETAQ